MTSALLTSRLKSVFISGWLRSSEDDVVLFLQGPTTTVGLYIDCGSIYESDMSSGASHLLEKMAFKSTSNRTHFRIVREVEAIGGHVFSSASREQMAYTADGLKTFLPEMLELLADCVRNPVFHEWEVQEQVRRVDVDRTMQFLTGGLTGREREGGIRWPRCRRR